MWGEIIMNLFILLFKAHLEIIYFFLKLIPTDKKKVVFISRQSDIPTLEFKLLAKQVLAMDKEQKLVFLTKKMGKGFKACMGYYFHLYSQMYHLATSQTCVLDSYCITVSVLHHKKNLRVVQIWHALGAIKKFGYQTLGKQLGRDEKIARLMRMHKNYDLVVSGSEAMKPYFKEAFEVEEDKIVSVGLPRVDYLLKNTKKIADKIYLRYPKLQEKKVILYVPTFRKTNRIHIHNLIRQIDFNRYHLIVKHHPNKSFPLRDERVYTCADFSSLDLLNVADFVITDYSAISIEAAVLEKPVYFYLYDYEQYKEVNGVNVDLEKEMQGCVFKQAKDLIKSIESTPYNIHLIKKFKNKYVTNLEGNSTYLIANYILKGDLQWENRYGSYQKMVRKPL